MANQVFYGYDTSVGKRRRRKSKGEQYRTIVSTTPYEIRSDKRQPEIHNAKTISYDRYSSQTEGNEFVPTHFSTENLDLLDNKEI